MEALEKAAQLKAELESLRPLDAEREARVWQKLRLDWNYHSNKLEGNSYTYGETRMLLIAGKTAGGKPQKDSNEISGHNEAINFILEAVKDDSPFTEGFIRHLHQMILVKPYLTEAKTSDGKPTRKLVKIGEYKTEPNHVETETGIFHFAEPIDTPAQMRELVEWFRGGAQNPKTNPILFAAEFHYRFVRIHPFDDGNGRMARLLMNFILMQYDYPPVIIRNEDKSNYIAALTQSDYGILKPFHDYIAENLVRSLEMMIKGAKGEDIEEPDDLDKELFFLEQKIKSVNEWPVITINKAVVGKIFDESIVPLIDELILTSSKFNKFYQNSSFYTHIGFETIRDDDKDKIIALTREKLTGKLDKLRIFYNHSFFISPRIQPFGYVTEVEVVFGRENYSISIIGVKGLKIVKKYSENLTKEELGSIPQKIAEMHKQEIENELKKVDAIK